jgi:hypothetical protein
MKIVGTASHPKIKMQGIESASKIYLALLSAKE